MTTETDTLLITEYGTRLSIEGEANINVRSEFRIGSNPATTYCIDSFWNASSLQDLRNPEKFFRDCEASSLMYSLQAKLINDRYPDDEKLLAEISSQLWHLMLTCKPPAPIAISRAALSRM